MHGGGFSTGTANDSSYDGEALARSGDVVVVSVNHRLNLFGHLDLSAYDEKYSDSANVGMWDIIQALEWIQKNIEVFGGDPDNVTVFGQSGGGAKVLALMSTPYAQGLFQKGIVQSGVTEMVGVHFTSQEAIPYVFRHSDVPAMNDLFSAIWVNFARNGALGADGLPDWEPYTRAGGATMLLDTTSTLVHHHDDALLKLLAPEYTY